MKSFHDFTVNTIDEKPISLSAFKGKKLLVVNVASECGLTPQYATLQELQNEFGGDNFSIIGFPANNFGSQEPGSNEQIQSFCQSNFGVTFPMMSKISVTGNDQHEVYQWLTQKSQNGVKNVDMEWNFQKFLIDEEGNFVDSLTPSASPADETILNWIKG